MSDPKAAETTVIHNLYSDHHGWLRGWLQKKLGCGERAADLTQDTFERVLMRGDVSSVREARPWLVTIAKRLLIDKSRRARLEQAYLEECAALAEQSPEFAPSAEELHHALQTLQLITKALEQQSSNVRQAFIWRHLDGLNQADIAERLQVSNTMVRKYLVQGLVASYEAFAEDSV